MRYGRRERSYLPRPQSCFLRDSFLMIGEDLHRRGTRARPNHRFQVRTPVILRLVRSIDPVIDRTSHRLERDFLRHAGRNDPPRLLPHRGLVPT